MIGVARKMRKHYVFSLAIEVFAQIARHLVVRGVALTTKYTLLERPRIKRAGTQHLDFVIGFDNQSVRAAKPFRRERVEVTQINGHANLCTVGFDSESERISGVVRNG